MFNNYKNVGYIDENGNLIVIQVPDLKANAKDAGIFLAICAGVCAGVAGISVACKKIKEHKQKKNAKTEDKEDNSFKKFKYDKFEYDKFEYDKFKPNK